MSNASFDNSSLKFGNFWDALQNFIAKIERENIVFNDEDFADLRDKSPGREVDFSKLYQIQDEEITD